MSLLLNVVLLLIMPLLVLGGEVQKVKANGIEIWCETFGEPQNKPLLLIMGAGGQALVWPDSFCRRAAQKGFYVIRYDNRDAGQSTCIDYTKNPYTLLDMAKDAMGVLDVLNIEQAHLFGLSMGGPIAELASVHSSERVLSIALMGSNYDYRPIVEIPGSSFSPPDPIYLEKVAKIQEISEDEVEKRIKIWQLINGPSFPLDEEELRKMHTLFLERTTSLDNLKNYREAIKNSWQEVLEVHPKVKCPTLIFQGTEDPLLGVDHLKALKETIPHAHEYIVEGMGHLPNPHFYDFLIDKLNEQ